MHKFLFWCIYKQSNVTEIEIESNSSGWVVHGERGMKSYRSLGTMGIKFQLGGVSSDFWHKHGLIYLVMLSWIFKQNKKSCVEYRFLKYVYIALWIFSVFVVLAHFSFLVFIDLDDIVVWLVDERLGNIVNLL